MPRNAVHNFLCCPAGRRLVTGSHDKYLILAETDGTVLRTWPSAHIHDLAISSDGRLLFSVTSEKKVGCLSQSSVGCMHLMR